MRGMWALCVGLFVLELVAGIAVGAVGMMALTRIQPQRAQGTPTPVATLPGSGPVTLTPTAFTPGAGTSTPAGRVQRVGRAGDIQRAIDAARPGDTIVVQAGQYHISAMLRITHDGPVTLRGDGRVVIHTADWYGILLNADRWRIENVEVTGARAHGIMVTGASHNIVESCAFYGNGWAGIQFGGDLGSANENRVTRCDVYENRMEGVYLRGTDSEHQGRRVPMVGNVIEYCTIHDNGAEGIQNTATFGPPAPAGTVIRNNRVYANGGDWGGGMCLSGVGLIVEGNTVYENGGMGPGGIYVGPASTGRVAQNVVYNNTGAWVQKGIALDKCESVELADNQVR
jgi:hypothetical protein